MLNELQIHIKSNHRHHHQRRYVAVRASYSFHSFILLAILGHSLQNLYGSVGDRYSRILRN